MTIWELTESLKKPQGVISDEQGRDFSWKSGNFHQSHFKKLQAQNLDLTGIQFIQAKLFQSDFSGSQLSKSDFSRAELTECNFTNTDLSRFKMESAWVVQSDFSHAVMRNADLIWCKLRESNFTGCDLKNGYMRYVVVKNCDFQNADLGAVNFEWADLTGDFRNSDLSFSNLSYTTLLGSDFRGARLEGVNLDGASLKGALFTEDQLKTAKNLTPEQLSVWRTHQQKASKSQPTGLVPNWSELKSLDSAALWKQIQPVLEQIRSQASDAIQAGKTAGTWPYRGLFLVPPPAIFKSRSPENRQPRDSSPQAQKKYDEFLTQLNLTAQRHNSVFVTGDQNQALVYAHLNPQYLFVILPVNGWDFTWSTRVKDLVLSDITAIPPSLKEFQGKYRLRSDNFAQALESEHEIMIHGDFYAVNYPLWQQILKNQWI